MQAAALVVVCGQRGLAVDEWAADCFVVIDEAPPTGSAVDQLYPPPAADASQNYPSPAAEPNADGSTTVYFGPKQPDGMKRGNWIQTMPGKGWWVVLRLYSPFEPFFDKSWRPSESEIELVK